MSRRDYLAEAARHIRDAEGLVIRQHELIQRLAACGQDTARAKAFLKVLQASLDRCRARRDAIARESAGDAEA